MFELPRMNEKMGNGNLVRDKHFSISGPEEGVYRAEASLKDGQHTMEVSLVIQVGTMDVLEVHGAIYTAPYDICGTAVEGLQKLVGMRIGPGLFGEMQKRVGGAKGCIHINELVREAVQLVAAHRSLTEIRRMQKEGRTVGEILEWGEQVRTWTCVAVPDPISRP